MAARKKKTQQSELSGKPDPRAPLDSAAFLAQARPVLATLTSDLLARADASPAVTRALEARHAAEQAAQRTAESFVTWRRSFVDQVAAAWLLSCVFVRTLEDRGLVGQARLAGPGAADSQRLFLELAPSLTERDYLLTVFRELCHVPAARELFDAKHNPVWLLAPSADAAKALLQLFRAPHADAPAFRFGQADTRFLGDLYQDLNDDVKKRYALLQTPRFVESFILDRTLERAIERFGLDDTRLIDPTCGSGHFLLGAFERLVDHRLRAEPGLDVREAARRALDQVFGADINPYAVAIARFRLTLAFLEKAGYATLSEAPALPLHLVVADSLLHNPHLAQLELGDQPKASVAAWKGEEFALEDEAAARDVLHRRYAAVVGNPPYITVKDAARRRKYAQMYDACAMNYALTVPFAQRFFQLGRDRGAVGMITANSFMKREFGKKLVEDYLPRVNLELVVNTSGAYIPGHGTPTVLLFGTSEPKQGQTVHTVLASRGEPSTPEDPEQGLVWRSIADHWSETGFENEYISVIDVERPTLHKHPWSLGGGGASELKELLEERADRCLSDVIEDIGFSVIIGEDEIFLRPAAGSIVRHLPTIPIVIGENIRDWALTTDEVMLRPFDPETLDVAAQPSLVQELWPWRTVLSNRIVSGSTTMAESNRAWYDVRRLSRSKHRTPLSITFAFVATHNHFVLDRGGKVFNRSAPVIKLPESATEDDHYALLAYLNSSTACFWMKQVFFQKSSQNYVGDVRDKPERIHYEFAGTGLAKLPLPPRLAALAEIGRQLTELGVRRAACDPGVVLANLPKEEHAMRAAVDAARAEEASLFEQMIARQEDLDWRVYELFGLSTPTCDDETPPCPLGSRVFEHLLSGVPFDDSDQLATKRASLITASRELAELESPMHKRPWLGTQGVFHRDSWSFDDRLLEAAKSLSACHGEEQARRSAAPFTEGEYRTSRERRELEAVLERVVESAGAINPGTDFFKSEAVPFLSALRFTAAGLEKHDKWQHTWALQRGEDAGENVGEIPVPPKYDQKDYRDPSYWRLRGKLDVPKERFISYPGCESDEDGEPVYGWAGWDHAQRARALGTLYFKRKTEEGWKKDRLTPMLAGLLELLPWLHQWHAEPHEDYGGQSPAKYFQDFLDGQCAELGLTHDDLRNWRPPEKRSGRGRKRSVRHDDAEDGG